MSKYCLIAGTVFGCGVMAYKWLSSPIKEKKQPSMVVKVISFAQEAVQVVIDFYGFFRVGLYEVMSFLRCGVMAYKWLSSPIKEKKQPSMVVKVISFAQEAVQVVIDLYGFFRVGLYEVMSFLKEIVLWVEKRVRKKKPIYTPIYTRLCTLPDNVLLIVLQYCDEVSVQNTHGCLSSYVQKSTKTTCIDQAVEMGNIKNMNWILERNGCPWGEYTFAYATINGKMHVLQWLKSHGCPWDGDTFANAIVNRDITILQWLKSNGCLWGKYTFRRAILCRDITILKWLKRNGCPWGKDTFQLAKARRGDIEIMVWLQLNGCPQ